MTKLTLVSLLLLAGCANVTHRPPDQPVRVPVAYVERLQCPADTVIACVANGRTSARDCRCTQP